MLRTDPQRVAHAQALHIRVRLEHRHHGHHSHGDQHPGHEPPPPPRRDRPVREQHRQQRGLQPVRRECPPSQPGRHRHERQEPRPGEPVIRPLMAESRNRHQPGRQQHPGTAVTRLADRDQSPGEREQTAHHQITGDVVPVGVMGWRQPQKRHRAGAQDHGNRRYTDRRRPGQRSNPRGPATMAQHARPQQRCSQVSIPHDEIIPEYGPGRKRIMSRVPRTSAARSPAGQPESCRRR